MKEMGRRIMRTASLMAVAALVGGVFAPGELVAQQPQQQVPPAAPELEKSSRTMLMAPSWC